MMNIRMTVRTLRRFGTSLFLVVGVSLGTNPAELQAQTTHNWTNIAGGNWNVGTNWDVSPTFAAGADETLNFGGFNTATTAGYTSTASVAAFTRVINFNNTFGSPTITVATTGGLTFNSAGGANPSLNQNGFGLASIGAFTLGAASPFTIGGSGVGNITLSGAITNTNNNAVTINQTGAGFMNTGASVIVANTNNFGTTGTTTITAGNVVAGAAAAFGANAANTIAVNGGTFRLNATGLNLVNNWTLNSNLNLLNSNSTVTAATFSGVLSGSGGIVANNAQTLTLTLNNASTFNGAVTFQPIGNSVGGITLASTTGGATNGTLANVTSYTFYSNTSLTLDNTNGVATRLNTSSTINLNRGNLTIQGNTTTAVNESFATLNTLGTASITANPGPASLTGAGTNITIGTWSRSSNSTALFSAASLGNANGANVGSVTIANDPGGAIGGILPYAYAVTSNSVTTTNVGTFVRRDGATGRLSGLSLATDYQGGALPLYLNPSATAQYRATVTQAALGNTTVNSLSLDPNTATVPFVGASVSGPGTLTVTSGAILASVNGAASVPAPVRSTIATGTLAFGGNTAYVHALSDLNVVSTVTGSGGFVKSGFGFVNLAGNNTFTGGVTINSGILQISADNGLGDASNAVTNNGGITGQLQFLPSPLFTTASSNSLTTARTVTIGETGGSFGVNNTTGNMTFTGTVGGTGYLFKTGAGTLTLNPTSGANTFSGRLAAFNGVVQVQNDASMGTNSALEFSAGGIGIVQPLTSFTTAKNVFMQSAATFFTAGSTNLQIDGILATQNNATPSGLTKLGTGDLVLTNTNTYGGATTIGTALAATGGGVVVSAGATGTQTGGRLLLQGANGSAALSSGFTLNPGTTLVLDNSTAVNNFRVGMVAQGHTGSELSLTGNATNGQNTTQAIGAYTTNTLASTVTVSQPATAGTNNVTTLQSISYTSATNGTTFFRGNNLGGATGDRTAIIFNTVPTLTAGIIPSAVGASSATGTPTDFVTMSGNAVNIFTAYVPNNVNTGATTVTDITAANALGAASTAGAARMSTGGTVELAGNNWTISTGSLLTTGTGGNTITNAGLTASVILGTNGRITNTTDLALGTNVNVSGTTVTKFGAGTLTLNQNGSTPTTWNVGQGTLRYGTGAATALPVGATVTTAPGATLDLNNNVVTLAASPGFGTVNIGTGGLTTGASIFMGTLQGSGPITITGSSTYSGNSSAYTGNWTINGVTLTVNSNAALGSGTINMGAAASATGATLTTPTTTAVTQVSNPIVVTATNTGTNAISQVGSTSVNWSGPITHTGTGLFRITGGSSSTAVLNGAWTLSGNITGTGPMSWFGGNWNITGNNSGFSGTVALDNSAAGVLGIGSNNALGTGTVTWTGTGTSGGMLRADGGARTLANNIAMVASPTNTSITGVNDMTFTGPVSLLTSAGTHNINVVNQGTTTFGGTISATTTAGMSQTGFGTLVLSGANTFTLGYTVNSGTLGLGRDSVGAPPTLTSGPVGTGTLTVNATGSNGAVLRAVGGARTVNNATTINGDFVVDGTNALTLGGTMNLGTAVRTVAVTNTANTTFGGAVSGTGGGLTKEGAGTLILSGAANTYTGGTIVNKGTLLVNNTPAGQSGTGTGPVTVNSGGTLGGTDGIIAGAVTVNTGGTIKPGSSPGNLNVGGGVTLSSGAAFGFEYRPGSVATANYDTGGSGVFGTDNSHLTLTAGTLSVDNAGSIFKIVGDFNDFATNGQTYSWQVSSAPTVNPFDISNLVQLDTTQFLNFNPLSTFQWHNVGGTVYFNFTPVPEPVHVLLLCGGAAAAMQWYRKRRESTNR